MWPNQRKGRAREGFTMIELLIVFALLLMIVALGATLLQGILPQASVGDIARHVQQSLRSAQIQSYTGHQGGAVYGVHFGAEDMTLYRGTSYDTRSEVHDIRFALGETMIETSFPDAAVQFDRHGTPSVTGTLTVSHSTSDDMQTIRIHDYGIVEE